MLRICEGREKRVAVQSPATCTGCWHSPPGHLKANMLVCIQVPARVSLEMHANCLIVREKYWLSSAYAPFHREYTQWTNGFTSRMLKPVV